MKQFLESIVKNIVHNPDQVEITETTDDGRIVFTIKVADEDMGRLIGKEGKVINSVRMIMRVIAIRQEARIRIDILDNQPRSQDKTTASTPVQAYKQPTSQNTEIALIDEELPSDKATETTILDNSESK